MKAQLTQERMDIARWIKKEAKKSSIRNVRFAFFLLQPSLCNRNIEGTVICLEEVEISQRERAREDRDTEKENTLEELGVEKQNRKHRTLHPKRRRDRAGSGQCAGSK